MLAKDIHESDKYVSDEELALEMDIPDPPQYPDPSQSPSLENCRLCPFKSYNADPNERTIKLWRKRALENCNQWAKKRKMNVSFEVINQYYYQLLY